MAQLSPIVRNLATRDDGVASVEYAVMLSLIVVAMIGIVTNLGVTMSRTFNTVSSTLTAS